MCGILIHSCLRIKTGQTQATVVSLKQKKETRKAFTKDIRLDSSVFLFCPEVLQINILDFHYSVNEHHFKNMLVKLKIH